MTAQRRCLSLNIFILLITALSWTLTARSADSDDPRILVAHPQLQHAIFGASVVVAKPLPDGSSIGFILNKPTSVTLGTLFPDDKPSHNVPDPVFFGGVEVPNVLFALVARRDTPGAGSIQIAPDIFIAINGEVVDAIIASESSHARFFAGFVMWRPGELSEELKRGLWYEMDLDTKLVFRKQTDGMWEELVRSSEVRKSAI